MKTDNSSGWSLEHVYSILRPIAGSMMKGERRNHTLQPTALVGEAAIRFLSRQAQDPRSMSKEELITAVSREMRCVLLDHARAHGRAKRGGGSARISLSVTEPEGRGIRIPDLAAFNEALESLSREEPQWALVVDLKVFGGMTNPEIARELGVGVATVQRDWARARRYLAAKLKASDTTGEGGSQ
jgi:RNA polymerase sigma factor (TIGR02999 family)